MKPNGRRHLSEKSPRTISDRKGAGRMDPKLGVSPAGKVKKENSGNISNSNFSKLNRVASLKQIFEVASPFGNVRKNSSKIIFTNTQGRSQFVTADWRELDRSDQEPIQHWGTGSDGQERDQGIGPMESIVRKEQPRQRKVALDCKH
jgi:hypothetical protein